MIKITDDDIKYKLRAISAALGVIREGLKVASFEDHPKQAEIKLSASLASHLSEYVDVTIAGLELERIKQDE